MAKKGITPSQIGVILRDSHGIAQGFKDYLTAKMLFIFARAYSLKCFIFNFHIGKNLQDKSCFSSSFLNDASKS